MNSTLVLAGLVVGAIYALVAMSYNLVFIASGIFNFAQAQFLMLGSFIVYFCASHGMPLLVAALVAAAVCGIVGALEETLAIRPLARRSGGTDAELVTTVGVAVVIEGVAVVIWGLNPRAVPSLFGDSSPLHIFGGAVTPTGLSIILAAVVAAIGLELLTRRTLLGLAGLATAENADAAMLRGINVRRLSLGAFFGASAFLGLIAAFTAAQTYAVTSIGDNLAIFAFVALTLGGYGTQIGALISGLFLGVIQVSAAFYFGTAGQNITLYVVFLALVLLRPGGLLGTRREREV